ncbi:MAG: type II secretion system protein GspG [Phycisphaerales bacterium JB052]
MLIQLKLFLVVALLSATATANEPYSRVIERDSGDIVLEMCTRTFSHPWGENPRVHLVSAIHIADQPYYQAMQAQLEGYDTVLFEGVKPAGLDPIDPDLDNEAKVEATRDRLMLLVDIAQRYRITHGEFPQNMDSLRKADDPRIAAIVDSIKHDAWGRAFATEHAVNITNGHQRSQITFTSYGADQQRGGEGVNADISETAKHEFNDGDMPEKTPEGIQTQLANALRVSFQLDEMDTTNPDWINADMDINQLQHALSEYGDDSLMILDMLEGESFSAKIAGFVLGFVARSPQLSSMMKLVMMDMLALVETTDIMEQQKAMQAVIVDGRNDVVIEYLKDTIAEHPNYQDIAIFYGAGHMPGLEETLIEMGYEPTGDTWSQAMAVNPRDTGLNAGQVKMMRNMIKSSLEQQMGH